MADPTPSTSGAYREQGNEEYKKGNMLKAAALYTRALKDDPGNAALHSNRSAALLQIHTLSKALADAEECVRLRPDWEKGHFRKGAVLEALGRLDEVRPPGGRRAGRQRRTLHASAADACSTRGLQALAAYQTAAEYAPGSKQIADKVRTIPKLARQKQAAAAAAAAEKAADG